MFYPVQRGVVENIEMVTKILEHLTNTEMSISLDEHPVMMTEPPGCPKIVREKLTELM
jgi:actin-related protein